MTITFANETPEYRAARNRLLDAEVALRRQMEAVAVQRRALPAGPPIAEDYVFERAGANGKPEPVKLSALFRPGTDSLFVYCYMFPRYKTDSRPGATHGELSALPTMEQPCPSCTVLLDQLNAAAPHFEAAGASFAVAANTTLDRLGLVARDRDWKHLHLLSSQGSSFKRDYHAEIEDGQQEAMIVVFKRDGDGTIRFFWATELAYEEADPGQDVRHFGTIDTFWNLLDLGPNERPAHFTGRIEYGGDCCP
jgi:predicted dithiol-disulfide oxidoreductase (DUF899 family)